MSGDKKTSRQIYKVCPQADWDVAAGGGVYCGSSDDVRDGFIHFSTAEQLAGTLAKHFRGQRDLVIVTFDTGDLAAGLKWQAGRNGQLFPHFYGELDCTLALRVRPVAGAVDASGKGFGLPDLEG